MKLGRGNREDTNTLRYRLLFLGHLTTAYKWGPFYPTNIEKFIVNRWVLYKGVFWVVGLQLWIHAITHMTLLCLLGLTGQSTEIRNYANTFTKLRMWKLYWLSIYLQIACNQHTWSIIIGRSISTHKSFSTWHAASLLVTDYVSIHKRFFWYPLTSLRMLSYGWSFLNYFLYNVTSNFHDM